MRLSTPRSTQPSHTARARSPLADGTHTYLSSFLLGPCMMSPPFSPLSPLGHLVSGGGAFDVAVPAPLAPVDARGIVPPCWPHAMTHPATRPPENPWACTRTRTHEIDRCPPELAPVRFCTAASTWRCERSPAPSRPRRSCRHAPHSHHAVSTHTPRPSLRKCPTLLAAPRDVCTRRCPRSFSPTFLASRPGCLSLARPRVQPASRDSGRPRRHLPTLASRLCSLSARAVAPIPRARGPSRLCTKRPPLPNSPPLPR